jgi:hypothetical protein
MLRTDAEYAAHLQAIADAQAAQQAADAAAHAAWLEGCDILQRPIRGVLEQDGGDGHIYSLIVDGAGGAVLPVQRESVRTSNAEHDAAKTAARAAHGARRNRLDRLADDLATIDTAVDAMMAIDLSATGPAGTAIAATSGANKTALTAIRNALIDVRSEAKKALNNARQACEKMRKEIK